MFYLTLTEAVSNGEKEQLSYDLAGNRLKKASGNQEETYYYNVKNQLVRLEKETGPVCYTYDQQGNMISEEGSTESHKDALAYDLHNARNIYMKQGLYKERHTSLREYAKKYIAYNTGAIFKRRILK